MNFPFFSHRLIKAKARRSALQITLVTMAAVAGYMTFMLLAPNAVTVVASVDQPQWAGHIERPDLDSATPPAPVTSSSYLMQEQNPAVTPKKAGAAAVTPKPATKAAVLPPHRPQGEETGHVASVSAPVAGIDLPPENVPLAADTKANPHGVISRVSDRLPAAGNLLKPFHAMGEAVHNFIMKPF